MYRWMTLAGMLAVTGSAVAFLLVGNEPELEQVVVEVGTSLAPGLGAVTAEVTPSTSPGLGAVIVEVFRPIGACCDSASGDCTDVDESACEDRGGDYQGNGTRCPSTTCPEPPTGACCLSDGTCVDATAIECGSTAGNYPGNGTACLGDADGNGLDDACEEQTGACCYRTAGVCVDDVLEDECADEWYGDQRCEDLDPPCEKEIIPAVSTWGMIGLAVLLVAGIAIKFGRRRAGRMSA